MAAEPNAVLLAPKTFLFGAAPDELPDDPSPLKKPPPPVDEVAPPPPNKLVDPVVLDPKAGAPPNAVPVVDVEPPPNMEADEVGAAELPPKTEPDELVVLGVDPNTDPAEDVAAPPNIDPVEAEVAAGADPKTEPVEAEVAAGADPKTEPVEAVVAGLDPKIDPEAVVGAVPNGDAALEGVDPKADAPPNAEPVVDVEPPPKMEADEVGAAELPPNTEPDELVVFGVDPNTDPAEDVAAAVVLVADVVATAGEAAVVVVVPNSEELEVAVPKTLAVGVALDPKIDPDEEPDEPNIDPVVLEVDVVDAATGFPPKTLVVEAVVDVVAAAVVVTVVAPPKIEVVEDAGAVPPNTDPAELVLAIDPKMVEADDDDAPPKTDPDETEVVVGVDANVVVVVEVDPKANVDVFEPNTDDVGAALTTGAAGLVTTVLVAVVDGFVVVTVLFIRLAVSVDVPEGVIPNTDDPVEVAPKTDPALVVVTAAPPPKIPLEEVVAENPNEAVAELVPELSVLVTVRALIPKGKELDVVAGAVGGFAPKGDADEGLASPPKLKDPKVEVDPVVAFVEAVGLAILVVEATEAIGLIIADVEDAIEPKALLAGANPDVPKAFPMLDETAEDATAANGGGGFVKGAEGDGAAATGVKLKDALLLELETGANPELVPDEANGFEGATSLASKSKVCLTLFCWPLGSVMTKDLIMSLLLGVFKCSPLVLDNSGSGLSLVVPFRSKYCLKAVVFSGENPSTTFFISAASGLELILVFNLVFSKSETDNFSIVSSSLINSSAPLITFRIFKSLICCSNCCKTVF